jgi:ribosomal protein S18 acetylase RimI-like enzyme
MEIGFAQTDDISAWLALVEDVQAYFPGLDMQVYRSALSRRIDERSALTARENGELIGALLFSRTSGELEFLAVHPRFRGKGTATALIRHMLRLFPGGSRLTVVTFRETDEKGREARKLYHKIGFVPGRLLTVFEYPCQEFAYTTPRISMERVDKNLSVGEEG